MKKMKKILAAAMVVFAAASLFAQDAKTAANEKVEKVEAITSIANPKGTKLFVVGDSTLSSFNDPYFYPRFGYGTKLQHYLKENKIEVINLAMSGRSSKSFLVEANYETLKNNIKKGDYLLIGFGHNDEKAEEARYTNPNGSKEEAGSFKNSLYENYIKLALDKKATPVLCTPIVRRAPGKAYEGSVVHVTNDQGEGFPGGDYPKAIRELGAETGVAVIDLTAKTKELYESLGDDGTVKLHAWLKHNEKSVDNTHLNNYGAMVIAQIVVKDLASQNKKFAKLVDKDARGPVEALDLEKNPSYIIPKYTPFTAADASGNYKLPAGWYGTVFGDCGGQEKIGNTDFFEISEKGGKFTLRSGSPDTKTAAGKIASGSDGIAFCFQSLPANKDFTISADVTVVACAANNQVAFGVMVRDDVHIDKFDNSISSNYVAAGGLKIKSEPFTTSWQRMDSALTETKAASSSAPKAGTKVSVSITKSGDTLTAKYGNEATATYTVKLTEVDAENLYVGLFTSRAITAEYSNVKVSVK